MTEEIKEYTKEELYAQAKEHNIFVCGDPASIDEENCIDYSHIDYLSATDQIKDINVPLVEAWPVLWSTIENFMNKLVTMGEDANDLKNENIEWKDSYASLATELRIAKKYLAQKPKRELRYKKYRKGEMINLEKEMARQIAEYKRAKLEKENDEISKED